MSFNKTNVITIQGNNFDPIQIGRLPLVLIAGPCAIESKDTLLMAESIKKICEN